MSELPSVPGGPTAREPNVPAYGRMGSENGLDQLDDSFPRANAFNDRPSAPAPVVRAPSGPIYGGGDPVAIPDRAADVAVPVRHQFDDYAGQRPRGRGALDVLCEGGVTPCCGDMCDRIWRDPSNGAGTGSVGCDRLIQFVAGCGMIVMFIYCIVAFVHVNPRREHCSAYEYDDQCNDDWTCKWRTDKYGISSCSVHFVTWFIGYLPAFSFGFLFFVVLGFFCRVDFYRAGRFAGFLIISFIFLLMSMSSALSPKGQELMDMPIGFTAFALVSLFLCVIGPCIMMARAGIY